MRIASSIIRMIGFSATEVDHDFADRVDNLARIRAGAMGRRTVVPVAVFRTDARRRRSLFAG